MGRLPNVAAARAHVRASLRRTVSDTPTATSLQTKTPEQAGDLRPVLRHGHHGAVPAAVPGLSSRNVPAPAAAQARSLGPRLVTAWWAGGAVPGAAQAAKPIDRTQVLFEGQVRPVTCGGQRGESMAACRKGLLSAASTHKFCRERFGGAAGFPLAYHAVEWSFLLFPSHGDADLVALWGWRGLHIPTHRGRAASTAGGDPLPPDRLGAPHGCIPTRLVSPCTRSAPPDE